MKKWKLNVITDSKGGDVFEGLFSALQTFCSSAAEGKHGAGAECVNRRL